ncbi:hypothetical protein NECAME_15081 [Necator americanus]|uniref:MAP3K deoxyribohydrolase domain-containing protein n=1 Tax=Necator americanus TaxID=51031 RepID=W2SLU6_NECAM|nr:hypothetical protein NECAME_15081 [Necator americanus]ETN69821.1 hypothetical protein NECAME_15081 [Necator americanus]
MALKDVQNVADTLNVNLTQIDFDRLDFGEANALDTFYNADVALVDVTVQQQQPSLCYHIGVRESMNQSYNILMTYIAPDSEYHIIDALKKTHAHLPMIVYMKFPERFPSLYPTISGFRVHSDDRIDLLYVHVPLSKINR